MDNKGGAIFSSCTLNLIKFTFISFFAFDKNKMK